ncbi:MAG: hypothetical protein WDM92_11855 [Caulobacteraceae bacterium]
MAVDHQSEAVKKDARSERNIKNHVSNARARSPHLPAEADLAAAAEVLNGCDKVAILAGQGALGASAALAAVAERLNAPVAKALLGKAALPDAHPNCTGGGGPSRHRALAGGAGDLRGPADRRLDLPLRRVLSPAGQGADRADRPQSPAHRPALPGRMRPGWRRRRDPAGAAAPPRAEDRPRLPRQGPEGPRRLAREPDDPGVGSHHADEAAGRGARAECAPARPRDRDHRLGDQHLLGGAAPDAP